jgi:hypothetical protein
MRPSATAIAMMSALELLMPEARGRSLASTRSAPIAAPGKFRARRRTATPA